MKQETYIAVIQVVVQAPTVAEAHDILSDAMSSMTIATTGFFSDPILDWNYLKIGSKYTSFMPIENHDPQTYVEGQAFGEKIEDVEPEEKEEIDCSCGGIPCVCGADDIMRAR